MNDSPEQTEQPDDDDRAAALADFLGDEDPDDWTECTYQPGQLDSGQRSYLVLTDDEADALTAEMIERDLWAFVPGFLVNYTPEGITADHLSKLAESAYEDASPAFRAMIGDRLPELIEDAKEQDGRGHFMNTYDGREEEHEHDGRRFYIYRVN